MIPLVVANERGRMAKLHACDTWQGLRVWGCGCMCDGSVSLSAFLCVVKRKWFGMACRSR